MTWSDGNSELKTMLECGNVVFMTWSDSRELVTLNCDVNTQPTPRNIVETKSTASLAPNGLLYKIARRL